MKKIILLASALLYVLVLAPRAFAQLGIVHVIAGGGTSLGEGVPPLSAAVNNASSVCVDRNGNVYYTEKNSHIARKIDVTTGMVHTIAGNRTTGYSGDGGLATSAQLNQPTGIAVDGNFNVYIIDASNYIRKVDGMSGIISTVAGVTTGGSLVDGIPATAASVSGLQQIVVDSAGTIYIATSGGDGRVRKIDAITGIITSVTASGGGDIDEGDGGLAILSTTPWLYGIAIDFTGRYLYTTDGMDGREVRRIDLVSGIIDSIATHQMWAHAAVDGMGNVYYEPSSTLHVIEAGTGIDKIVSDATSMLQVGMYLGHAELPFRVPIAADAAGNIYCPSGNSVIKIDAYCGHKSDSFEIGTAYRCDGPYFNIVVHNFTPGMSVKTDFGDGSVSTSPVVSAGYTHFTHTYSHGGIYYLKHVLYSGGGAIDSISYAYNYDYCRTIPIRFYYDANNNNVFDPGVDNPMLLPVTAEIDSNGIIVDKITTPYGINYYAHGVPGDVYKVKFISTPSGMMTNYPASGLLADTLQTTEFSDNNFGLYCSSGAGFDLQENLTAQAGPHAYRAQIILSNLFCTPTPVTLEMHVSPKYRIYDASISPSVNTGNVITWNFTGLSATTTNPVYITVEGTVSGGLLSAHDTVHTSSFVSPTVGDINPANNTVIRTDTVTGSFDPNYIAVVPQGYISAGTELTYTIAFENVGNDTAHNIYILDSLSDYLDMSTLSVVASSANMNFTKIKEGVMVRAMFDFPNIMLPDSSHHGLCEGMIVFKVKTKTGLKNGTIIPNRAGIYFDDNEVVMTNTVNNIIGKPTSVATVNNDVKVEIFPNPATDEIVIKTPESGYEKCLINNCIGQLLGQRSLSGKQTVIDISALPPGLYYLTLKGDRGTTVQKVVKL